MKGFFYEVGEFFSGLFGRPEPRYIGFLKKPSIYNDKPSKKPKGELGFQPKDKKS